LLLGLWVFALGVALAVRAELGVSSWDVLHDAVRRHTPLTFGAAVVTVSVFVLFLSFLMGVKPGPGTIANVFLVGGFTDVMLRNGFLEGLGSEHIVLRTAAMVGGVVSIALGSALYIGANLGAGPRDSLMLATAKRFGRSPGTARAVIEGTVLVIGAVFGGAVGIGTAVFAILIGPAIDIAFKLFKMEERPRKAVAIAGVISTQPGEISD
jgi:uncharacterized membrane protein YczE